MNDRGPLSKVYRFLMEIIAQKISLAPFFATKAIHVIWTSKRATCGVDYGVESLDLEMRMVSINCLIHQSPSPLPDFWTGAPGREECRALCPGSFLQLHIRLGDFGVIPMPSVMRQPKEQ